MKDGIGQRRVSYMTRSYCSWFQWYQRFCKDLVVTVEITPLSETAFFLQNQTTEASSSASLAQVMSSAIS